MLLNEITYESARPIDSYGPGFFRIAGKVIWGDVLITPWYSGPWGGFQDCERILSLAENIDVLFLGMGAEISHAPSAFRGQIEAAGIGLEVMNSPAACRTYNVLLSEGRRIAVALTKI
ncbi:MAG: hypothetical protein ACI9O0_001077 [Paracoccaceae bacterium]|jgi:uncharacterized protein